MTYKIYSDGCHLAEFSVAGAGGYLLKDNATVFEFSEQIEESIYHEMHERFAVNYPALKDGASFLYKRLIACLGRSSVTTPEL